MSEDDEEHLRSAITAGRAAYDETTARANAKILAYVLREFQEDFAYTTPRAENKVEQHLAACLTARVSELEPLNGTYGCDTGCEYAHLEAVIACDCGFSAEYDNIGAFGNAAELLGGILASDDDGSALVKRMWSS